MPSKNDDASKVAVSKTSDLEVPASQILNIETAVGQLRAKWVIMADAVKK
jgi:hypothetical protein